MTVRTGRAASWLTALSLLGCATEPVRTAAEFDDLAAMTVDEFPGAARILSGFEGDDAVAGLRVGDMALLALRLTRDGETSRQLLLLEVAELPRSRSTARITHTDESGRKENTEIVLHDVIVVLRRFDAEGVELGSGRATLYREALQAGWWRWVAPDTTPRQATLAFVLNMSLQNLATAEPMIEEMLFTIVDPPSLLSIATHLGVHVTLVVRGPEAGEAPPPRLPGARNREIRVLPLDLNINGSQALWCELLVVQPNGGNTVCGGLVGAVARHPSEPDRDALLRLIATRRGGR